MVNYFLKLELTEIIIDHYISKMPLSVSFFLGDEA